MSNSQTNHLHSTREPTLANLWPIALPLSGAMLSQAAVGLVDTALVGHLGGLALASVSIGSYLVFVLVAIITGLGTGWHGLVSQHSLSHKGLMGLGLVYGILMSICLGIAGAFIVDDVINVFVLDDRINTLAAYYAQSRLWALPAIVLSIAARIYWSELGTPWQYTQVVVVAHLANIPISYGLIYGIGGLPAMGAIGAGVGTSIALWLGVLLQLFLLLKRSVRFEAFTCQFSMTNLLLLLRFTWPPMLQQLAFALHLALFLWILSQLGASAMAASFAVLNVGLLLILPAIGLGQAALSLIGNAMANKEKVKIIAWSKLILATGILTALALALFVGVMAPWFAQLLLVNRELQQLTAMALPWYATAMILETCIIILSRFVLLTGLRKTGLILVTASQWLLFLPLLAWLAPTYGFMAVWWLHGVYRILVVVILWWIWRRYLKGLSTVQNFSHNKE
mgnify:FL=1|tara:strand:- start:4697 stop:6055 length:1359 start_codon:yes stop_codon:yes gene_type:complete